MRCAQPAVARRVTAMSARLRPARAPGQAFSCSRMLHNHVVSASLREPFSRPFTRRGKHVCNANGRGDEPEDQRPSNSSDSSKSQEKSAKDTETAEKEQEGDKSKSSSPDGSDTRDEAERLLLSAVEEQLRQRNPSQSMLPSMSSFELRRLLQLLVEYGGTVGTAAVILGLITKIDPFGGFIWDMDDIITGLLIFAPVLLLDLALTLPDFSSKPEEAKQAMRLFIQPELLARLQEEQRKLDKEVLSSSTNDEGNPETASQSPVRSEALRNGIQATASAPGGMYMSVSEIADAEPLTGSAASVRKLRLALEMLQEFWTRNNPTAMMTPINELFVILVSVLADEMLYRAVLLTLVGLWIRDRLFEAGAEDTMVFGGAHLDTLDAGMWLALGLGAAGGVAAFTLRALREQAIVQKAQEMAKMAAKQEEKRRRPKALPGWEPPTSSKSGSAEKELSPDLVAEIALQLSSSLASLNATVWTLEGVREVAQVTASGTAFILTSNLAAPYSGAVLVQIVFSACQRLMLDRKVQRRRDQAVQLLESKRARAAAAAEGALKEHATSEQQHESAQSKDVPADGSQRKGPATGAHDLHDNTVGPNTSSEQQSEVVSKRPEQNDRR